MALRGERILCGGGHRDCGGRGKRCCCRCGGFDGGVGAGTEDMEDELKVMIREHGGRRNTMH